MKEILIGLYSLTKFKINFKLEDLDYLLDKSKKEFEISGLKVRGN